MKKSKMLKTIIRKNLKDEEEIFITTKSKLNDLNNENWWKMEKYTREEIFHNFIGDERVDRYWHEDGLCIILNN